MNKAFAGAWDEVEAFAAARGGFDLVREGHRFTFRAMSPGGRIDVWAEENAPRFGCSVQSAVNAGEDLPLPVSFRCWNVDALAVLVEGVAATSAPAT